MFRAITARGLGQAYIDCYRMVSDFFQMRRPLVIVLCGTAWTGALLQCCAALLQCVCCARSTGLCGIALQHCFHCV